jgi:Domain of unknown function (DUF4190)
MKRCPTCNQTFVEEWLSFCTLDGTTLMEEAPSQPPPTVQAPAPPRVTDPNDQATWNLPSDPGGAGAPIHSPPKPGWQPPPPPLYVQPPNKSLGVASMVLGIISLAVGWMCFGPIPAIAAIILGSVSLSQIKKDPERVTGRPFALTGVITGSLALVLFALVMVIYIFAAIAGAH